MQSCSSEKKHVNLNISDIPEDNRNYQLECPQDNAEIKQSIKISYAKFSSVKCNMLRVVSDYIIDTCDGETKCFLQFEDNYCEDERFACTFECRYGYEGGEVA